MTSDARLPRVLDDGRPISKRRVAFGECDPYGILYNTRFLDYVLDVRLDHLNDVYGVRVQTAPDGSTPVIVGHQVSYLAAARSMETVLVSTATLEMTAGGLLFEGVVTSEDGKQLKFHQWTRIRVINTSTGRPSEFPPELLADGRRTIPENIDFDLRDYDSRVRALRDAFASDTHR